MEATKEQRKALASYIQIACALAEASVMLKYSLMTTPVAHRLLSIIKENRKLITPWVADLVFDKEGQYQEFQKSLDRIESVLMGTLEPHRKGAH